MTTYTCPDGHTSNAGDYCDVCGAPIGVGGVTPAAGGQSVGGGGIGGGPAASPAGTSPGFGGPGGALDLDSPAPPPLPGAPTAPMPTDRSCPNCGASNLPSALYCEDCGYDFTTGQLPRPLDPPGATPAPDTPVAGLSAAGAPATGAPATGQLGLPTRPAGSTGPSSQPLTAPPITATSGPGHVEWVAEVWVDPDWYASQDVSDPCPSAGMPVVVPVLERTVLIGRTSTSRNIHPQIDVSSDNGVSRRHAQLNSDGQRWWVEDLQSANGTYVGGAGAPLPTTPITAGQRIELADDDRIYLGAWTRIVVRRATAEEASLGT